MKLKWTKTEQNTFDGIKCIVACETLLAYSYFNEEFKIHTNGSDNQLVAVIIQEGKAIAFYSKKLNDTHKRYTVTENELLSTVEYLTKFRPILLGQILRMYTDNKNLTCRTFNTNRVLIWKLILK